MDEAPQGFRRTFLKSAAHVWLALLTVGAGFVASSPHNPIPLLVGGAAYALGWIYLPDMPWFRRRVERLRERTRKQAEDLEIEAFVAKRDGLVARLSTARRVRYEALLQVCREIESAAEESPIATDVRLKKLEELLWAFLRLLTIEEAQERFLETERREDLPRQIAEAGAESTRLLRECEVLRAEGSAASARLEARQRLYDSCRERLSILKKRADRTEHARDNLLLIASEEDRLVQQVKLIRADAVATRNMEALSNRIDAAVVHLDETNRWIAGLEEFQDLVGEVPSTVRRAGFDSPPSTVPAAAGSGATGSAAAGSTIPGATDRTRAAGRKAAKEGERG